ncbi:profilin, putative [Entamoeba invadens IP1]|uniref:Profilin n=2 Tax=Entamoeba invadens TaxID=33085 RepID=L7FML0_ENTIV|nr:profilin, putative [Entamoeba invadens IP1]XP_004256309.1 profilin, putative [Entamoeba invadens IP1]XP_004260392.1 profilin, putative [Entamoeba invadens IP1]XP_004260401.1 profilin, putative [Entamoeba invadens IP1]XP_004261158.1 profilin, putative [Entamoeba invadens IP1]BAK61679.1 profilin [Entamoeba invadens]ELP89516.1 profilin, putative [Entamoeba invadens IP1]ELP89538.1 profilin, putative [Entamoeba invadens IP1]ELP93621.1 profilin, putative [Entamoeba invadens IP1]ELP93630.1 pro|eukprot:XP_004256287.1 profilin, putative [Entamoeba invadens IP1]
MSWDGYTASMIGAGKGHGGIILATNGAIMSQVGLTIQQAEATTIANAIMSGNIADFQSKGLHIGGVKYTVTRADKDEGTVFGKAGAAGVSIYKGIKVILIGYFKDASVSAGQNSDAVYKLKDYMGQSGY